MISLKTKILRVSPGKYVWGEDGRDVEHPGGPGGMYDIWQGDGMYIKVWTYKKQKVKQLFVLQEGQTTLRPCH